MSQKVKVCRILTAIPDNHTRFKFVRRRSHCATKGHFCQAEGGKGVSILLYVPSNSYRGVEDFLNNNAIDVSDLVDDSATTPNYKQIDD